MIKKPILYLALIVTLGNSCAEEQKIGAPLEFILASDDPKIKQVMDSVSPYEVQIRYTQVERQNDTLSFIDHCYNVKAKKYFYPASTVKFPIAVLTLEQLNTDERLHLNTRFYVEGDTVETSFAEAISNIFAVSDNSSYNRLFEFLGQDHINTQLEAKGVAPIRISHRLSVAEADEITTKPLIIYLNDSTTTMLEPTINSSAKALLLEGIQKGKGFYKDHVFEEEPFDFSLKNYYPIDSQHEVLKRVIFPEAYPKNAQFNLSSKQRDFLLKSMHTLPKELGYDTKEYYDSYVKFFMYGDTKDPIPEHIKIYNKVGYAYGTLTDCAYIRDTKNKIEFLLTATILVNKNGIFNDDTYEYDTIGIPFLAALGRTIYTYELNAKL
ncbi:serine hydrolase [Spongiimicrobium salis]|uniref:serine hydrolase n=1 Tax=Spongiimicrobium salis TaxID=1667022 RepID=UPI00374CE4D4